MRLRAVLFALLAASVASAAGAPGYHLLASVTILHQDSPDKYIVMQTLEMKPGTFTVLVYGK